MCVLNTLPQHLIGPQQTRVGVVIPQTVLRAIPTANRCQLFQSVIVPLTFQVINHLSGDISIYKSMDLAGFYRTVSYEM